MNSHCPKCNAYYKVTEQHIGVRVDCRKCGAALTVKSDGLHLADDADAAPAFNLTDDTASAPRRQRNLGKNIGTSFSSINLMQDIATWIYGAGTFLVILFLFLPLIDVARVASRSAAVESARLTLERKKKEFNNKKEVTADDRKTQEKLDDEWKKENERLQEYVEDARLSVSSSLVTYRWGMMFGFFLLTVASLGFLTSNQLPIRRVIGSITLLVIVVLNVIVSVVFSAASTVK